MVARRAHNPEAAGSSPAFALDHQRSDDDGKRAAPGTAGPPSHLWRMDKLKDIDFGTGSGLLAALLLELIARLEGDTTLLGQLPPSLILAIAALGAFARFWLKPKASKGHAITEETAKALVEALNRAVASMRAAKGTVVPATAEEVRELFHERVPLMFEDADEDEVLR